MYSTRSYIVTLFAWLALYGVLLYGSIWLIDGHYVGTPVLRSIVGLLPMIAGFGILGLVMREHRKHDELQQKITAEAIMFAFGTTAIVTFTYGFLQRSVAAPDLSYFFVWPILAATWMIGSFLARRRYR